MKLCISHAWEDKEQATRIAELCSELGVKHYLDERCDWLLQALRPLSEESTNLLVIVSQHTDATWWLPFHMGRASERKVPIWAYLVEPGNELPGFLRDTICFEGLPQMRDHIKLSKLACSENAEALAPGPNQPTGSSQQ